MPEGKVSVPSTLSGHAAEIYRSAFLGAYEGTCAKPGGRRGGENVNRDACAAKVAWAAVKKNYKKGKDENWVAKAGDPVVGPISDVPLQTSLPVYGTGVDYRKGEGVTKLQRWRRAYIKALQDECRNADQPVECARRKANAAAGFVETDVKPIQRGGEGSGHHGHEGRPGEVGGSQPGRGGSAASYSAEVKVQAEFHKYAKTHSGAAQMLEAWDRAKREHEDLREGIRENFTSPLADRLIEILDTDEAPEYQREDPLGEEARKKHEAEEPFFETPYEATVFEKKLDGMRRHKFLTKEIEKKLPALYSQENNPDPTVWAKWFHPYSQMTWYATEYDPQVGMFFGYVDSGSPFTSELGYFSRQEMAETLVRGLPIERDKYFSPVRLSEVKRGGLEARAVYRIKGATYPLITARSNGKANGRSMTMDQFNDYPISYVERRGFDTAKRQEMAKAGTAMSDGSFPIADGNDVTFALRSLGRTSQPRSGVVAHIRKRAKELGFKMTPALKRKAATVQRYLDRKVLRSQTNEVDKQHIRTLADNPIHRPDYISSEVWRSLPPEQRTVQAEASRRIVERNYAQAVEDAEMSGWRVSRHYYSPDDYYFTKRFSRPGEDKGVLVRAIMVRRVDSVEWELLAMSEFASSSIARMLPSDIVQHKSTGLAITPLIEG